MKEEKRADVILIIDDEEDMRKVLSKRFVLAGYEVISAKNGVEGLERAKIDKPDLIILDVLMPEMGGMVTKLKLNEHPTTAAIPVIFLTGKDLMYSKIAGLRLGADDYMTKPFNIDELLARVASAIGRKKIYEKMALTDPLTGLPNVQAFKKEFSTFFNLAKRYRRIFTVAVIDIDDFKSINDRYGHQTGDAVLQEVARAMKKVFRQSDVLARYGGDEFVVLMPEMTEEGGAIAVARFREEICAKTVATPFPDAPVSFSVSVGLAVYQEQMTGEDELFELADKRMYEYKTQRKARAGV